MARQAPGAKSRHTGAKRGSRAAFPWTRGKIHAVRLFADVIIGMNDILFTVVDSWQTRNWRRDKKADARCRDFGLAPLHKRLYAGTLYRRERDELHKGLE